MNAAPLCDKYRRCLSLSFPTCTHKSVFMQTHKAELLIINSDYEALMHILAVVHKHEGPCCMYLVGGDYTLFVRVSLCVISLHVGMKNVCTPGEACALRGEKASLQTVV